MNEENARMIELIDDAFEALRTNEAIRSGAELVVQTMMDAPEFRDYGYDKVLLDKAYALGVSAFAVGYRFGFEASTLHRRRMDAEAN